MWKNGGHVCTGIHAEDYCTAGCGLNESEQHADGCGFAGTVGTQEAEYVATHYF